VSAPAAPVLLEHHVCERTGLSPSELDALVRAGVFPKPRRNRNGAHCSWTVDDIEAWRRRNEWVERMRTLFVAENDGMAEIDDSLWRAREPYEVLARIRWARASNSKVAPELPEESGGNR
jgi:predicted DNA-binding transcriptional regulator AlpA